MNDEKIATKAEARNIVQKALDRRQKATTRFYFFSMSEAREKWKNGGGIASGLFKGVRRCFTRVTFEDQKPEGFKDYKRVGEVPPDGDIDFIGGIDEARFNAGAIGRLKKKGEEKRFKTHNPMDAFEGFEPLGGGGEMETDVGENVFSEED